MADKEYSRLVSKILSNDVLKEAVISMVNAKTLNLITEDWKSELKNNLTYQDFSECSESLWKNTYINPNYEYAETKDAHFDIIIVGYCKIIKPYNNSSKLNLTILNSAPLNEIAKVMCPKLELQSQISKDFKFTFDVCGPLYCENCRKSSEQFIKAGYALPEYIQPCIMDTKIYDGMHIVNRFLSHMEGIFQNNLVGIVHLKINKRYNFIDTNNTKNQKLYRISGEIFDIVGFNENKLTTTKTIDVGILTNISPNIKENIIKENIFEEVDEMLKVEKQSEKHALEEGEETLSKKMKFLEDDNDLHSTVSQLEVKKQSDKHALEGEETLSKKIKFLEDDNDTDSTVVQEMLLI